MGYGTRPGGLGHTIKTYWPDDGENEFYLASEATLEEILERARAKWPELSLDRIKIEAEYIHTDCLTYDDRNIRALEFDKEGNPL